MGFLIIGLLFLTAVYLSESQTNVNYDETITDDQENQVDNFEKQAHDEIQKPMAQGKPVLAEGIITMEAHLVDQETQLEKLNLQPEVGLALLKGLVTLFKAVETNLKEEMKNL